MSRAILIPVSDAAGQVRTKERGPMYQVFRTGTEKQGGERGGEMELTEYYGQFVEEVSVVASPQSAYTVGYLHYYSDTPNKQGLINQIRLAKGMKVCVFADPMTQYHLEGVVTLVKFVGRDDVPINGGREVIETWTVRFEGESQLLERRILSTWI